MTDLRSPWRSRVRLTAMRYSLPPMTARTLFLSALLLILRFLNLGSSDLITLLAMVCSVCASQCHGPNPPDIIHTNDIRLQPTSMQAAASLYPLSRTIPLSSSLPKVRRSSLSSFSVGSHFASRATGERANKPDPDEEEGLLVCASHAGLAGPASAGRVVVVVVGWVGVGAWTAGSAGASERSRASAAARAASRGSGRADALSFPARELMVDDRP